MFSCFGNELDGRKGRPQSLGIPFGAYEDRWHYREYVFHLYTNSSSSIYAVSELGQGLGWVRGQETQLV